MDRSTPITLYSVSYVTDGLMQPTPVYSSRTVYADVRSTGRREWQAAREQGLNPELEATMFGPDYEGETIVEISGQQFTVYRTYQGRNDELTLYLERQVGGEGVRANE